MPRYEFKEGSSNKFWEIEIDGTEVTTKWGRIGSKGQSKTKDHGSDEKAQKEYDKLVKEKTKKGYLLVEESAGAQSAGGEGASDGFARYEFTEGTSNKFWEIRRDGNEVTTRWGRIGTDGQEKTKEYDDEEKAQKEYDKLVKSKTKKGYEPVQAAAAGPKKAVGSAQNPDLEAPLLENPNDKEAALVYADWLQGEGDPRGELITLQAEGKTKEADALIKKHKEHLLGDLVQWTEEGDYGKNLELTWNLGFIKGARVRKCDYDDDTDVDEVIGALMKHPSAKFIQELTIGMVDFEGENYYGSTIAKLAEAGPRPTMRKIYIGDFEFPDETEISWTGVSGVNALWQNYPNLEEVTLQAGEMEIGDIHLPKLKKLSVITGGLDEGSQKQLAKAKLPELEELTVWFGREDYGFSGGIDAIGGLLEGKNTPKLKHLGLMNAEFTDDIVRALPGSGILKQLESLDLSMGTLRGAGLQAMLDNKDAFKHLRKLDLSANFLSDEECAQAKELAQEVMAGRQKEPWDWDEEPIYYASVGE